MGFGPGEASLWADDVIRKRGGGGGGVLSGGVLPL